MGTNGAKTPLQTPLETRGTIPDPAPLRGTIPTGRKPSHSKGFRPSHSGPAPVPPLISVGADGQGPSSTRPGHERGTIGAGGTTCDHYWIRIGPYLKCTRCGELRAAHHERTR